MISVTVLTKNSEKYLERVLTALELFNEVLIYDNGSTDRTLEIAKQYPNVKIHRGEFLGFGPTHNLASSYAKNDWILSVDSDEIVTPSLADEIRRLSLDPGTVYSISRNNYYNEKWIRWCGWHPDRCCRLYHKKTTRFSDVDVHESIITKGLKTKPLQSPLVHFPYENTEDFLGKMQIYTDLFAKQNAGKVKSSFSKALTRAFFTFFKCYILKRGFLGGAEGFTISLYNSNTVFYKYLKLAEQNRLLQQEPERKEKRRKYCVNQEFNS